MIKQLTDAEIADRRKAADAYYETIQGLEADLNQAKEKCKHLRAQIAENTTNFDAVYAEIISGEVYIDDQLALPGTK